MINSTCVMVRVYDFCLLAEIPAAYLDVDYSSSGLSEETKKEIMH